MQHNIYDKNHIILKNYLEREHKYFNKKSINAHLYYKNIECIFFNFVGNKKHKKYFYHRMCDSRIALILNSGQNWLNCKAKSECLYYFSVIF